MSARPQIHLDDEDITAGVEALQLHGAKHVVSPHYVVMQVVKAMNSRRGGDPAGTIRVCDYSDGTCAVAVRVVGEDGAHFWKVTHPSGSVDELDGDLQNWTLVSR